jgi:hypothetical protein
MNSFYSLPLLLLFFSVRFGRIIMVTAVTTMNEKIANKTSNATYIFMWFLFLLFLFVELESALGRLHHQSNKTPCLFEVSGHNTKTHSNNKSNARVFYANIASLFTFRLSIWFRFMFVVMRDENVK